MAVYDCFPFFNELELLEIRLNELDAVVDQFVLIEATRTHQKKPKSLVYNENKERFKRFHSKINHIILDKYPTFFTKFRPVKNWHYEKHQREMLKLGLNELQDNDRVIISDLDEIPSADAVSRGLNEDLPIIFEQRFYSYYLNNLCTFFDTGGQSLVAQRTIDNIGFWRGSVMVTGHVMKELKSANKVRRLRDVGDDSVKVLLDAGWHFTSVGEVERIITKLESFAHAEFNKDELKKKDRIEKLITNGNSLFPDNASTFQLIELDDTLPLFLSENESMFSHLIRKT